MRKEAVNVFIIQNNIEIVEGYINSCIYDLNNRKLYQIDNQYLNYMKLIRSGNLDQVPNDVIEYLNKVGILCNEDELIPNLDDDYGFKVDFAWIEITQNCNLTCRHCYENSSSCHIVPEMDMNDFYKAVTFLQNMNVNRIQLVGGEPLVHSKFIEMLEYVSDKFESIEIYTNGTLLDDDLLDKVSKNNATLAFSLYSNEPGVHDYVTCAKGSHQKTMNNIKNAKDKNIQIRVAGIEMKGVPQFKLDDESILFKNDMPRLTGRANLNLYTEDMLRRKLITIETFKQPIDPTLFKKGKCVHNCFGERLYIDTKLNLYPCAMERRFTYGNVENQSFETIVESKYIYLTKDKIDGCKDCEFRYACYDCRTDSNGAGIYEKPWYCTYDPYKAEWKNVDSFINELLKLDK